MFRPFHPVTCVTIAALLSLSGSNPDRVLAQQQGAPKVFEILSATDPALDTMLARYADGENLVLGVVDGKPITVDSIKSELGTGLDAAVNVRLDEFRRQGVADPSRAKMELTIIYFRARSKAIEMILDREAAAAGIDIPDALIDAMLEERQREQNIDPKDLQSWARFTLQNFGKTPLELREEIRRGQMRSQIQYSMAGRFGPLPQRNLPVFFPLDVSPREMLDRYEQHEDQWRRLALVRYSRLVVTYSAATTVSEREKLNTFMTEAQRRLRMGEAFASVEAYIERVLKEEMPGVDARVSLESDVTKESDADLDSSLATRIRTLKAGELSDVEFASVRGANDSEPLRQIMYVVKLYEKNEDVARAFDDIVVQRQLYDALWSEKLKLNMQRVEEALVDQAVIIPGSMRVR